MRAAGHLLFALALGTAMALGAATACSSNDGSDDNGPLDVGDIYWPDGWDGEGIPPQPICKAGQLQCAADGGIEQCQADGMAFAPLAGCDDGNPCTDDSCAVVAGGTAECLHPPTVACDDQDACTVDVCLPWSGDCVHEPSQVQTDCCQNDPDCDDGHECTSDLCDVATGACVNSPEAACVEYSFKIGSKGTGQGQLSNPKGLEVLPDGRIAVADAGNSRVVFFSSKGAQLSVLTSAFDKSLVAPSCIYSGPDDTLYVCDTGNDRMLLLDRLGTPVGVWPPALYDKVLFFQPLDVCVDGDGFAYVADGSGEGFDEGNRLMKINPDGKVVAMKGKTGSAPNNFHIPSAISLSGGAGAGDAGEGEAGAGNTLVVSDQGNDRIQVFDLMLERLGSFGEEGKKLGQLNGPTDLSLAQGGRRIFVADSGNQRIQVLQTCQPDCTGKVCGDDGCGGPCGECPTFATCDDATGACEGFTGEGGEGCTDNTGAGVKGCAACGCEACVCKGEEVIDPTQFVFGGDSDAYCCDTEWDGICVFECVFVCGYECPLPEGPAKEPTFSGVYEWKTADTGNLAAPIKVVVDDDRFVYVLDTVKSAVYVYRLFLSPVD